MKTVHFYSNHRYTSDNDRRRCEIAKSTWLFDDEITVEDEQLPRLFDDGNGRKLPFIKDLFDFACQGQPDDQVMVFSNTDVCFRTNTLEWIGRAVGKTDACYALRSNFQYIESMLPDWSIPLGFMDGGTDCYIFRAGWWRKHRDLLPDMLIGRQWWDSILNVVIDKTCPEHAPNQALWLIYHEVHPSFWKQGKNNMTLPSQIYCRELARGWFTRNGIEPKKYHV